jgi:hypothetical protein
MPYRLLFCLLIASVPAYGASTRVLPNIEFHATMDKKDVLINFTQGNVSPIVKEDELSGFAAVTSDFTKAPIAAFMVFDDSVTDQRLKGLVQFDGLLKGVAQCKRVRLGNSPMSPDVKIGILGEGCILKSLNH